MEAAKLSVTPDIRLLPGTPVQISEPPGDRDYRLPLFPLLFLVVEGHTQLIRTPVYNPLWMLSSKSLGDVAAPANGLMRCQNLLQLFGGDFGPRNRFAVAIQQRRRVIMPMDFSERFVAEHAFLSLIPSIDDR